MTDYNVTVGKELLPELLSSQNGLAKLYVYRDFCFGQNRRLDFTLVRNDVRPL